MTINSLTAGAASQLSYASRLSGTSSTTATRQSSQMPPPPPGDGGGLLGAIADALKSVGIGGTDDTGSTSASSGTSTSTSESSETGTDSEAQALGSFLENLMGALHAQNSGSTDSAAQYGEPPQGGPDLGGGPGKLASDLQSLISSLEDGTGGTESAASTDSVAGTEASDSTAALQSSFKSLLTALGGDGSDASSKLSSFLQTLSSRLPSAGSAGNLINTTA
ncbi:hypothetical protein GJV26_28835 [Massilia dura]|uniref:Uncharacterized protein n=1 Tax=Pseudoduganella dura TaxID=321982 RepID=A0A6I3XPM3_9BURK|nr:hypothetical protein [Pseudoduganella dura]MUI16433.1 hypothetical protein [Pseudoduganella dura]GGX86745.1 hypothetical protein GCM10007386_17010 [Pseudoduganella dura]